MLERWERVFSLFSCLFALCYSSYLQTSLPLEKRDDLMTSGAIQEYVPAADIFVVLCHSRAKPKSVIFKVFLPMSSFSIVSSNKTEKREKGGREGGLITVGSRRRPEKKEKWRYVMQSVMS